MSNTNSKGRELTACQQRWLEHLKAWQAQETLGLKAYAEQHGLSVSALYTAKRHFKREGIVVAVERLIYEQRQAA